MSDEPTTGLGVMGRTVRVLGAEGEVRKALEEALLAQCYVEFETAVGPPIVVNPIQVAWVVRA